MGCSRGGTITENQIWPRAQSRAINYSKRKGFRAEDKCTSHFRGFPESQTRLSRLKIRPRGRHPKHSLRNEIRLGRAICSSPSVWRWSSSFLYQPVTVEGAPRWPQCSPTGNAYSSTIWLSLEPIERGDVVVFMVIRDRTKNFHQEHGSACRTRSGGSRDSPGKCMLMAKSLGRALRAAAIEIIAIGPVRVPP